MMKFNWNSKERSVKQYYMDCLSNKKYRPVYNTHVC